MDLTLRLQSKQIKTHTLLADRLQSRQENWLDRLQYSRLSSQASIALNAMTAFANQKLGRWQQLTMLLQKDLSYPWGWLQVNPFPTLQSLLLRFPRIRREKFEVTESDRTPSRVRVEKGARQIEQILQQPNERQTDPIGTSSLQASVGLSKSTDIYPTAYQLHSLLPLNGLFSTLPVEAPEPILIPAVKPWIPRFSQPDDFPASPFLAESVSSESPKPAELEPTQRPVFPRIFLPRLTQHPSPQQPPVKPQALQPLTTGVPLEPALRSRLEQRMGFDLGSVRVHADSTSASLADRLQANAFTVGSRIFFAAGKFQPQTRAGIALLVHELTHVRQQLSQLSLRRGQLTLTQRQTLEQEAHAQEQAVLRGERLPVSSGNPSTFSPVDILYREFSGLAALPQTQGGMSQSLIVSDRQQTIPVMPLRQESTATPSEATPAPATSTGTPPQAPAGGGADPEKLAQQVYELLQRRLRLERERGGIQRWHG